MLSGQALRVLAVAYQKAGTGNGDLEQNLVFYGLLGLMDPPRPEAVRCVKTCREAGIVPVMITGDHVDTAFAIAKELGIAQKKEQCMTGAEIDQAGQKGLLGLIEKIRVFARVSPEHKVWIVEALKAKGKIVAMTGDGVNDAPS